MFFDPAVNNPYVNNPYLSSAPAATTSEEDLSIGSNIRKLIGQTIVWGTGVVGGGTYGIALLAKKVFPALISSEIRFRAHLLFGTSLVLFVGTAKLVYLIASKFLGERPQMIEMRETDTRLDRLRSYSWKVIFYLEGILKKIDQKFSQIFSIYTLEQIKEQKTPNSDLHWPEVCRLALIDEIKESSRSIVPLLSFSLATIISPIIVVQALSVGVVAIGALNFLTQFYYRVQWIHYIGSVKPSSTLQPQDSVK